MQGRTRILAAAFGLAALLGVAALLLSSDRRPGAPTATGTSRGERPDFSERFARFRAAPERNGDPAKVVWPEYVTEAGPEVKRLYEFQIENGDLMRYMPCYCGCQWEAGHSSNRDCYVRQVRRDGSVVLDPMAPT